MTAFCTGVGFLYPSDLHVWSSAGVSEKSSNVDISWLKDGDVLLLEATATLDFLVVVTFVWSLAGTGVIGAGL